VPRRVELAASHGGLFWISPQFQLDLVMRNGLTQEMEENLLREVDQVYEEANIYVNQQVANVACELISAVEQAAEEDEYFAVPWENQPAGANGGDMVIMRALQFSRDSYHPCAVSEQTVYRGAAVVNPYVKRLMVEEEIDVKFVERIKHPQFTHAEDTAFKDFTMAQRDDSHQKRGRSMSAKERGAAEHKFFKAWSNHQILPPVPLSEISSASVAPAVVIVTPANDNKDNIFYFKDFSSELVKTSSVGGCTSYKAIPVCSLACSVSVDVLGLMHERTGHFNKRGLIECVKSKIVSGLKIEDKDIRRFMESDKHVCDICARAKATRKSFSKIHAIRGKELGSYISVDMAVFINCPSRNGYRYVTTFVDHATKMLWSYPMRKKSEFLKVFLDLVDVKLHALGVRLKHYHADGGKELISAAVISKLQKEGSRYTWTPADTPELNSTSERKWRTLGEMCLSMLLRSGLPTDFWWDAYEAATYIAIRLPTKTIQGYMTPYECVHGEIPDLSHLRIWGAKHI
jgi:hypothetical protein